MSSDIFDKVMNFSSSDNADTKVKLKPSERLLEEIKGYGFDLTQLEPVLKTKGHQLIVSCAGSGKTTAMTFKVIYDLKTGRSTVLRNLNGNNIRITDKIWVSTFLKSGSEELKNSYRKWCNRLHCADMSQSIQFCTLHAEFKRALNALGMHTDIISDTENKNLLKKVLKTYGIRSPRGTALNDDEVSAILGALICTRNRLDEKRYSSDIYDELGLVSSVIDCILRDWKAQRVIKNMVDFEDLQEILYDYCYNKADNAIIEFLSQRYNYIYIDEFQDTSQIQYAVLKAYCFQAKQVVAIGDDDQTIYSWRGSDNSIITEKFLADFKPAKNDLSVNFRCPNNILSAIKPSIEKNTLRFEKTLCSAKDGGMVRIVEAPEYKQMALTLGDLVYEDIKAGRSVAILTRVNSDGLLPAIFFDKMNMFSYSVSGKNMTLDCYIGRLVMSIIHLFTDSYSSEVRKALSYLTWDSYGITHLLEICRNNGTDIWGISEEDLVYSCPEISEKLISWRDFRKSNGDILTVKFVLQDYRYSVFVNDTQFNDVVRSVLLSVESLLDYYSYDSAEDFLSELESINDRLRARVKLSNANVRIATVHEFKGKEADSVYVWNDSEDVFPFFKSCNSKEEIEEERRVHYIACTRAKSISTILYKKGKEGKFVKEMDLSNAKKVVKETSGVLKKTMEKNLEEDSALRGFENSVSIDTGEVYDDLEVDVEE
jgi:DNA helicase-2/ATP-dependent DNA helicase PcrA